MGKAPLLGYHLVLAILCCMTSVTLAQDPIDRDRWNVAAGDWGNADNWVDDLGDVSGIPFSEDDRWALVDNGVARVAETFATSGLTIGENGTVEIFDEGSLSIALTALPNSVGQTQIDDGGGLILRDGGSFAGLSGNVQGTLELAAGSMFSLSGDLQLNGNLEIEVTPSENAVLTVGGQATLGGQFTPVFNAITPGIGSTFTFLHADSVVLDNPELQFPNLPRGVAADFVVAAGNASIAVRNKPILQLDRASQQARILNAVGEPIEISGYVVESARGLLDPSGFHGFGDQGWDRPNPSDTSIREISSGQIQTIRVDDILEIGSIYDLGATTPENEDITFVYFTPEGESRNGIVEYVGPANDLVLNVNPETGEVTVQHLSPRIDPIEVTGYRVVSPSGSIRVDAWNSLEDSNLSGWLEENAQPDLISEINSLEPTLFSNGTVVSLGNIFDVVSGERDLFLQYTTTTETLSATVEYQVGNAPLFLEADLDRNGTVDFADFLTLSFAFGDLVDPAGSSADINADGSVNFPDFLTLSAQFGMSTVRVTTIPEPHSNAGWVLSSLLILAAYRSRRWRKYRTYFCLHEPHPSAPSN